MRELLSKKQEAAACRLLFWHPANLETQTCGDPTVIYGRVISCLSLLLGLLLSH